MKFLLIECLSGMPQKAIFKTNFPSKKDHLHIGKILECHGCGQFEERGLHGFEDRLLLLHEVDDILLADGLTVHADALAEVHQVGRCLETYAVATHLQDSRKRVSTRALSVGTSHMNSLELLMWMIEVLVECMTVLQSFLIAACALTFEHGQLTVKIFTRFLVSHSCYTLFIY